MSFNRWAAKRDGCESDIVDALRKAGALVLHLNKFDLLVYLPRRQAFYMLDCKGDDGRITASQQQLLDDGFPLQFVGSPQEALKLIGVVR